MNEKDIDEEIEEGESIWSEGVYAKTLSTIDPNFQERMKHFDEKKDETNRAFIDIFSCKEFNEKKALEFCSGFFEAKRSKIKVFIRR